VVGVIRSGKLDRRIAVLRAGPAVDDGYTQQPGALRRVALRWASVKPEARRVFSVWLRWDVITASIRPTDKLALRGPDGAWQVCELLAPAMLIGRKGGIELFGKAQDNAAAIDPEALAAWAP
jgi:hypothetical protein